MAKPGPKAQPNEVKRKKGNPGKRPLPDEADLVLLPAVEGPPDPQRPLAAPGQRSWEAAWRYAKPWLAESDIDAVQTYCEAVDDYSMARQQMLNLMAEEGVEAIGLWRLRKSVNEARKIMNDCGDRIGLSSVARSALGVAEVRIAEGVASILQRPPVATSERRLPPE